MKARHTIIIIAAAALLATAAVAETTTVTTKQLIVTPHEGDPVVFNIADLVNATFDYSQTTPPYRYIMINPKEGAGARFYLDEVQSITYSEKTEEIEVPVAEPKVGDYYYSDGTWSDGGLISINDDGTSPVWAEEKPAPIEGKKVIGIVAMTNPDRMAQADKDAGYTHGYVISSTFVHDPGNVGTNGQTFTTVKYTWDEEYTANVGPCVLAATWYADIDGRTTCANAIDIYGAMLKSKCPAIYYTDIREHPETSSRWFIPSTGQLWDIIANLCGSKTASTMLAWRTVESDATYNCSEKSLPEAPMDIFNATLAKVADSDKELLVRVDYDEYVWDPFNYKASDYRAYCPLWTCSRYNDEAMCIFEVGSPKTDCSAMIECMAEWYNGDCYLRPILAF